MNGKRDTGVFVHTKERIAGEALRLFSVKGFKETTIKDIAREVGITEGAIYRHFRSKEEIIEHLNKACHGRDKEADRGEGLSPEGHRSAGPGPGRGSHKLRFRQSGTPSGF